MKTYKVIFIKYSSVLDIGTPPIMNLIEQIYHSDNESFKIDLPNGYQVLSITQTYPDIIRKSKNGATA